MCGTSADVDRRSPAPARRPGVPIRARVQGYVFRAPSASDGTVRKVVCRRAVKDRAIALAESSSSVALFRRSRVRRRALEQETAASARPRRSGDDRGRRTRAAQLGVRGCNLSEPGTRQRTEAGDRANSIDRHCVKLSLTRSMAGGFPRSEANSDEATSERSASSSAL